MKLLLLVPAQFISELLIKLSTVFIDVYNTDACQSKHRIHVILESEDYNIPAQEEIRSQIMKKEMSLFEAP